MFLLCGIFLLQIVHLAVGLWTGEKHFPMLRFLSAILHCLTTHNAEVCNGAAARSVLMSHRFSQSHDMDQLCQDCFGTVLKTFGSDATTHDL